MVGNGILRVCLNHPHVEKVLAISRRPCGLANPKLKEIIHQDLFDLSPIEDQLSGYDACFYCIGVTSILIDESNYRRITRDLTLSFAKVVARINPGMTFCYVSGFGADSPDKARFMQARVKGLIESDLFKISSIKVYSFRPGLLKPVKGQKNIHFIYYLFNPFYHVSRRLFPRFVLSLHDLGSAMINTVTSGYVKQILEVPDIVSLSRSMHSNY